MRRASVRNAVVSVRVAMCDQQRPQHAACHARHPGNCGFTQRSGSASHRADDELSGLHDERLRKLLTGDVDVHRSVTLDRAPEMMRQDAMLATSGGAGFADEQYSAGGEGP